MKKLTFSPSSCYFIVLFYRLSKKFWSKLKLKTWHDRLLSSLIVFRLFVHAILSVCSTKAVLSRVVSTRTWCNAVDSTVKCLPVTIPRDTCHWIRICSRHFRVNYTKSESEGSSLFHLKGFSCNNPAIIQRNVFILLCRSERPCDRKHTRCEGEDCMPVQLVPWSIGTVQLE